MIASFVLCTGILIGAMHFVNNTVFITGHILVLMFYYHEVDRFSSFVNDGYCLKIWTNLI